MRFKKGSKLKVNHKAVYKAGQSNRKRTSTYKSFNGGGAVTTTGTKSNGRKFVRTQITKVRPTSSKRKVGALFGLKGAPMSTRRVKGGIVRTYKRKGKTVELFTKNYRTPNHPSGRKKSTMHVLTTTKTKGTLNKNSAWKEAYGIRRKRYSNNY